MKPLVSLLVLFLAVAVTAADDAPKKDAGFDAAKLVGDWTYVSGTRAGEKVPKEHLAGKVTITKDTMTLPAGPDKKILLAYKVNAKTSPVNLDMEIKEGPGKGGKADGIVELKGDNLKICYAGPGKRPTKFESTKENEAFYFVLKRSK